MYLTAAELTSTYNQQAGAMDAKDVGKYLNQANTYAFGKIGGIPTSLTTEETVALKTAVSMAFDIFSKGETGQADPVTGNITEASPGGVFIRKTDPLKTVDVMLAPIAAKYDRQQTVQSENSVRFL